MTSSKNPLIPPTFFTQTFFPQNSDDSFWLDFFLVGVFRRSPSQKNISKKLIDERKRKFFEFSGNDPKNGLRKIKICIFLKILKSHVF